MMGDEPDHVDDDDVRPQSHPSRSRLTELITDPSSLIQYESVIESGTGTPVKPLKPQRVSRRSTRRPIIESASGEDSDEFKPMGGHGQQASQKASHLLHFALDRSSSRTDLRPTQTSLDEIGQVVQATETST